MSKVTSELLESAYQTALSALLAERHPDGYWVGELSTSALSTATAVAALSHPGVVQVLDFGTASGQPYLALEYLPGGTLTQRLDGAPLPARDAARLAEQLDAHLSEIPRDSDLVLYCS